MPPETRPYIIIAGPTASGKSALAIEIARQFSGTIINADSMQVYRELSVITARPSPEDEARVPHRLYGVLGAAEPCSAGRWRAMAWAECEAAWAAGRLPVVTGGTGLYIKALTEGLSPIPDIPNDIRQAARSLFAKLGNAAFHARLAERDPVTAARLHLGNSQRLVRAWEVLEATGRPLAEWQAEPAIDVPTHARFAAIALLPARPILYAACDTRFRRMLEMGALDEVRALDALGLDPALPALKALGVPELIRHLRGEITLERAETAATRAIRNFAKRQVTWFRHQIANAMVVEEQFSESLPPKIFPFIRDFLLTEER
ncbi:MAG: tRNA (adenosine(37)-N6)-dimethylallyltransferase MiaA [Rhodospirillales bacterium]|nr:tRNA (adenosine(37)-N6)-dimethylallyltransferase MiaA [Rhodospirillales bacterium]